VKGHALYVVRQDAQTNIFPSKLWKTEMVYRFATRWCIYVCIHI